MVTAIKHLVPDQVKPSFVIFDMGHSDAQPWMKSVRVPRYQKLQMMA